MAGPYFRSTPQFPPSVVNIKEILSGQAPEATARHIRWSRNHAPPCRAGEEEWVTHWGSDGRLPSSQHLGDALR